MNLPLAAAAAAKPKGTGFATEAGNALKAVEAKAGPAIKAIWTDDALVIHAIFNRPGGHYHAPPPSATAMFVATIFVIIVLLGAAAARSRRRERPRLA